VKREPDLRARVDRTLDEAENLLKNPGPPGARAALAGVLAEFRQNRARWAGRMRVAVAGRVSSGKSTLVNALLGDDLLKTAVKEETAAVTWLRYAQAPELTLHYKQESRAPLSVHPPSRERLAEFSAHRGSGDGQAYADDLDYVAFGYRNAQLDRFDLIDTPGLNSVLGADSDNTMRHLSPRVDTAEAIIVVFNRAIHEEDEKLLAHFLRTNAAKHTDVSPLTTIGAYTHVERLWSARDPLLTDDGRLSALVAARSKADAMMRETKLRRLLYDMRPVASKIGAAAGTFGEQDLAALTELADCGKLPLPVLGQQLARDSWHHDEIDWIPVAAARRKALFDRFTGCGVMLACHLIREGARGHAELREQLRERSGLTDFRDNLVEHFGERADMIKLTRLIGRISALAARHDATLDAGASEALTEAALMIGELEGTETGFRQLQVLRDFYAGQLQFDAEQKREMFRLFRESHDGSSAAELLGTAGAPAGQLADHAARRAAYWYALSLEGGYYIVTRDACKVMARSYDDLRRRLTPSTPGQ
jgi:hypothetical protein